MRKVRVGFTVDGKFRRLFSLAENNKGELVIGIQSATVYQPPPQPNIVHQKYTVHASEDSQIYNTITHTLALSDHRRLRSYSLTDAIKSKKGFAYLFSRRCPDLSIDRYLLQNSKAFTPVNLGTLDVKTITPVLAVFVGHAETEFDTSLKTDFVVRQTVFQKFRVVIIYTGIPLPSHSSGRLFHARTIKPQDALPEYQELLWSLMQGWSSETCLKMTTAFFIQLLGQFIGQLIQTAGLAPNQIEFLRGIAKAQGAPIPDDALADQDLLIAVSDQDHPPTANLR